MSIIKDISTDKEKFDQRKKDWWDFHLKNRHVYARFVKHAMICIRARERVGLLFVKKIRVRFIFEKIKEEWITTNSLDDFTINNDFYKYYALQFIYQNPHLAGAFEHRQYIPSNIRALINMNQPVVDKAIDRYNQRKQRMSKSRAKSIKRLSKNIS